MKNTQNETIEILFRYGLLLSDRLEIMANIIKNFEETYSNIENQTENWMIEFVDDSVVNVTLDSLQKPSLINILTQYAQHDYFLLKN